jgi:hypothetical protein
MEYKQEEIAAIVQKMYNTKQGKGRKLKPKNKLSLVQLMMVQVATKQIATLNIFSKLTPDIVQKIHDKNECKNLTAKEYVYIADVILQTSTIASKSYISHVTPAGLKILEDVKVGNIKNFKVRYVFNTQERQLLLG